MSIPILFFNQSISCTLLTNNFQLYYCFFNMFIYLAFWHLTKAEHNILTICFLVLHFICNFVYATSFFLYDALPIDLFSGNFRIIFFGSYSLVAIHEVFLLYTRPYEGNFTVQIIHGVELNAQQIMASGQSVLTMFFIKMFIFSCVSNKHFVMLTTSLQRTKW